jgi:hypothetical protein
MSVLSEKLYQQAAKKAAAAKKNATHIVDGKKYNLEFDARGWFYCVTDENGEWIVNINSKQATEAKRFLTYWLTN